MSATLGALLRELEPTWSVTLFEKLDAAAAESSDPWNNAGTGHSALCELNYTPRDANGDVNIDKAVTINEQFQVSRQFWAHAVDNGILREPSEFINPIPHVSYTHGADGVDDPVVYRLNLALVEAAVTAPTGTAAVDPFS